MLNKTNTDVVAATRKGTDPITLHLGVLWDYSCSRVGGSVSCFVTVSHVSITRLQKQETWSAVPPPA